MDGRDYHFIDPSRFEDMVEKNAFLEWATVHGNRYGTARAELAGAETEGVDLIFDIDFQGARQIKAQYPASVGVFVLPPSIDQLHRRLRTRGTETSKSLERRFRAALEEIGHHDLFDYLLVNDDLDVAYSNLRAILLAERCRHERLAGLAEAMLA